jgi:cysteine desulfurase/selenocysteine lyase
MTGTAPHSDLVELRNDFPILDQQIGDHPLAYFDSAATTQKPQPVIDAVAEYYAQHNANVHRAAHALSERATRMFEAARERVRERINARSAAEVIWTRGTTEAINLVAHSYAGSVLAPGDEILITEMEHHSNIVPWQLVAQRTGAQVVACGITDEGELDLTDFERKLGERTRIVAFGHVSNALGTINPVRTLIEQAHDAGAVTLLDGAQAMAHLPVDVQALDCDFYAFSGHKMFGPTGIGVLYGREALLESMPPWQSGGEMIEVVSIDHTTFNSLPYKFEAGTPNIAGAIGLGAAIDYLNAINAEELAAHEAKLLALTTSGLAQVQGVRLVGTAAEKTAVVSFLVEGAHPQDIGTLLDQQGIAVRAGHHCAMPLMQRLGIPGTVRASLSLYNSEQDIERLIAGVQKAKTFL